MMQQPTPTTARRADACAALAGVAIPTLVTWLYFVALRNCPAAVQQTAYGVGKTVQFAFPLFWLLAGRLRFRDARAPAGVVQGLAFGGLVTAAILLCYHFWLEPAGLLAPAGKAVAEKVSRFGVAGPAGFVVMAMFYVLVHSFLEEYYWRWFIFGLMRRLMPPAAAVALSSLAFTLHHVIVLGAYFGWRSPATAVFSLAVAVAGAVWAWMYHRSGSLLGPWLSHALADAAIFAVGYNLVRGVLGW
jgi:membrane protease YdiL (CAAX protease family)